MIQYLCVAAPAFFAGLVQGVTGFGAGILLMMFYPFCFSMVQSSAMCQLLCAVLCISIVWRYRRFVRFRMCILPLVFYFPVYLAAMQAAARLDMDYLKPVLGIFLIALAVYFILGEGKIKISANPGTAFVCAALAGIIDAFFGIGGPTMVVYQMGEDSRLYRRRGTNMYQWRVSTPHLINAPRGCAGIRRSIMSADADPNPAPRLASES